MAGEKKEKAKKKIGERAASILTETSGDATVNANERSQIMAQTNEIHNTKGNSPKAEETMWNQGAKWQEMMTGIWKNVPAFTTSNKVMEPLMELTKMQQRGFMKMYQVWSDQLGKISDASRSGDIKKVMEICVESNKEFFNTCQEVVKEQTTAQYELLRKFIPALPNFPGARS